MKLLRFPEIVFSVFMAAVLFAQAQSGAAKPQVTPVFLEGNAPAFLLECRNNTGGPIRPLLTPEMLRIDGQVQSTGGSGYGTSGSRPPSIPPGGSWTEIAVLHASRSSNGRSVSFAVIRNNFTNVALTTGRHTVEFQCGGTWSDESAFYWEERSR